MKLKKISLKKAVESECPTIKVGTRYTYLCKIDGEWFVGSFDRQWYGLNFTHCQFDAPGYNSSGWEEVYQLVK